jgi:hypothetical protein
MVMKKPLPAKPMYTASAYARGIRIEAKEHPTLPRRIITTLVKDHLRKNPKEY